jgi:CHC2 zinc finger/Toprim-like
MNTNQDLQTLALDYHRHLPERIRAYLSARGIPDALIHRHLVGWNGQRITIPIPNRDCEIAFFKLARDPEDSFSPKMLATPGSSVELYGWETVFERPDKIVICEGEFDRLVLEAKGFAAVTSTGGAGSFRKEWAEALVSIPEVYVCFDRDEAGRAGVLRLARFIPQAKIVELPQDVGEAGDVTDFFVRLGRMPEDFSKLLDAAQSPAPSVPIESVLLPRVSESSPELSARIERVKDGIPIDNIAVQYTALRPSGKNLIGLCPFHPDREPSLVVFPDTRTFHCFGCRAGGDVISFLRLAMHLSFFEALEALEEALPFHDSKPAV